MTAGIHCCREDDDLAKAVRHMEALKIRRLPVIRREQADGRHPGLGDISRSASGELVAECVKSVRHIIDGAGKRGRGTKSPGDAQPATRNGVGSRGRSL